MKCLTAKEIKLSNYKSFDNFEQECGNVIEVSGRNGAGKSTIASVVPFVLFGTDEFGKKLDTTPHGTKEKTEITVTFAGMGEMDTVLNKKRKGAGFTTFINDVETKVTDTEIKFMESLGINKEVFLSMYNPSYFFTLHWKDQRNIIFDKLAAASMGLVENEMKEQQFSIAIENLNKYNNSIIDAFKAVKKRIKDIEDERHVLSGKYEYAYNMDVTAQPKTMSDEEKERLLKEKGDLEIQLNKFNADVSKRVELQKLLSNLTFQAEKIKEGIEKQATFVRSILNGNEGKLCNACGNELSDQQKEAFLKAEKQRGAQSVKELEEVKNKIIESEKELKDITNSIGDKNADDLYTKIAELRQKLNAVSNTFHFDKEGEMQKIRVELDANKEKKDVQNDILSALEKFEEVKTTIIERQVNEAFKKYSDCFNVSLFKENKTDGMKKETFEILYNDKPYDILSLGEKAKAAIELSNTLTDLYGVLLPLYIDNAESISADVKALVKHEERQLFTANVTDTDLTITNK